MIDLLAGKEPMGRKTEDVVIISEKGTVPIKKKIRDKLRWKKGDSLLLLSSDGELILKKEEES